MKNKFFTSFLIILVFLFSSSVFSQFTQQWVRTLPSTTTSSVKSPIVLLDKNADIYVLSTYDTDTSSSFHNVIMLTKYLSDGTQIWSVNYNNPSNVDQQSINMMIIGNSDIFILGVAYLTYSNPDYLILKYNSSGVFQWANQYDLQSSYDVPTAFTIDNQGNIYILGISNLHPNTVKINPSGDFVWNKIINNGYMSYKTGGIVTDNSSNIYIQYGYVDFETNILKLLKYNSNGDSLWNKYQSSITIGLMNLKGLKKDSSNFIYSAFQSGMAYFNTISALTINKFNSDGNIISTYGFGTIPGPTLDLADFLLMNDNSLVLTGSYLPTSLYKYLICKYNSSGTLTRAIMTGYISNQSCFGNAIAMDKISNIYVTGRANVSSASQDYLTVKYNSALDSLFSITYNGFQNNNSASSIAVDTLYNVYVTGLINSTNTSTVATIKYSQPVGINKISSNIPDKFSLSQNFPNPFNPATVINYKLPITDYVKLAVSDLLGKEVAILVNETQQAGEYNVTWDASNFASGIYFYTLVAGDFTETKRMVLVK